MWARRGAIRCAGHILVPGVARASLGMPVPAPERGGGLFASLLALEDASSAVRKSSRRRRAGVQGEQRQRSLRCLQPTLNNRHPARKVLMLGGEQP